MAKGKISGLTSEEFTKVVLNSDTIKDALNKLGLRAAGSNYQSLKRRMIKEGIDVNVFPRDILRVPNENAFTKYSLDEILIENSSYSNRGRLKRRLIKEGLLEEKCSECGQGDHWLGKKLVLVLDHINGIYNDNRKENLRLLCPNCNSQTDTFAGRNHQYKTAEIPAKYNCSKCGKETKGKGGTGMCSSCNNKARAKGPRITKPELERLMEDNSLCAIGRMYSVSDNAVRKWAKKYGLI